MTTETLDQKIEKLYADVLKRESDLAAARVSSSETAKTDGKVIAFGETFQIQTANLQKLVRLTALLLMERENLSKAAEFLGVNGAYHSGKIDDWLHDVKRRVSMLTMDDKEAELAALKQRLEELRSPELRRQAELEKIAASLGI